MKLTLRRDTPRDRQLHDRARDEAGRTYQRVPTVGTPAKWIPQVDVTPLQREAP